METAPGQNPQGMCEHHAVSPVMAEGHEAQ